jgi:hypothetical protein
VRAWGDEDRFQLSMPLTAPRPRALHRAEDIGSALKGGVNVCQRQLVKEVLGPFVTEFVPNFGREGATPIQRGSNAGLLHRVQAIKLIRHIRHTGAAGLARPQEHPAHGALHRAVAASVQGLLAPIDRLSSHLIMTPGGWGQNGAIEPPASTRSVGFGELEVEQAEIRGLGSGTHRAGDPLAGVERKAYSWHIPGGDLRDGSPRRLCGINRRGPGRYSDRLSAGRPLNVRISTQTGFAATNRQMTILRIAPACRSARPAGTQSVADCAGKCIPHGGARLASYRRVMFGSLRPCS